MAAKPHEKRPGYWELRAVVGPNTATGRSEYLYGTFKGGIRGAQRAQRDLEAKADQVREDRKAHAEGRAPDVADANRWTVTDALEGWFESHGVDLEPGARDTARNHIGAYLTPGLGAVELWRLRGRLERHQADADGRLVDLSAFYRTLTSKRTGEPLAPATIRRIHTTVRSALQYAVRVGWLAQNPAADAKLPTLPPRRSTTPDAADLARLLARLAGAFPRLHVFALVVGSGVRPVEAYALRWAHVDLADAVLRLTADGLVRSRPIAGRREVSELRVGETRKRRVRTIALDPVALAALANYRRRVLEYALAAGVHPGPQAFVFSPDPDGATPYVPGWAYQAWNRQVAAARRDGLPLPDGIRLYDVRHFMATQALGAGFSPVDVAARMANSPQTVLRFYGHAIPANDRAIAEAMGTVWGGS